MSRIFGSARRAEAERVRALEAPLIATYRKPSIGAKTRLFLIALLGVACLANGYYFATFAPRLMMPFTVAPSIFALLLIWALPAGEYAPTKSMTGFFWAFLIALIAWPNYLAIALPGLPWLTFLRITGAPMVALFLICVSVSKKFRGELGDYLRDTPAIWKTLLVYVVIVTLTLPLSNRIGETINRYVIFLMNEVCIFFVSCYIFSRPKRLEYWAYVLLACIALICFFGVWESRIGYVPWAGHIPWFLKIEDPSVMKILAGGSRAATGVHRVASVATTALNLAEILGLSAPFALHIAVSRYPIVVRALAGACVPLIVWVIVLTDARLGFMAMLVSGSLYVLLASVVRWREARHSILGPAVVLSYPALFVGLVGATFLIGQLRRRVWGDGSQNASNEARKAQWRMAVPKIEHNPIGHGYGEAGHVLGFVNLGGIGTIDSYYLNLLLDTGILGFVTYLVLFLSASAIAARTVIRYPGSRETRLLIPLAVTLVAFIVVKSVLSEDANHPLVYMMLGAIAALVHRVKKNERAEDNDTVAAAGPART